MTTDAQLRNCLHCMDENQLPLPNFRYGQSIFHLPHRPKFSDFFDLCLHWVSLVHGRGTKDMSIPFNYLWKCSFRKYFNPLWCPNDEEEEREKCLYGKSPSEFPNPNRASMIGSNKDCKSITRTLKNWTNKIDQKNPFVQGYK